MSIRIHHVTKRYSRYPALNDVSVEIETGELIALLGPSGSGKTTLLRVIAGLEFPESQGSVLFQDRDVTQLSAYKRKAGFVFQAYALFAHMNVFENIAFALRILPRKKRPPESTIRAYVTGDKSELKAGAAIATFATKKPDGSFETSRINVGRDGIAP